MFTRQYPEGMFETLQAAYTQKPSLFMHKYVQLYPDILMCGGKTLGGVCKILWIYNINE
jgi:hypothetical protein